MDKEFRTVIVHAIYNANAMTNLRTGMKRSIELRKGTKQL